MTSRERILSTINHKEPDQVPVDLGSTPSSGISAIAYNNLKNYLGMKNGHTRVYDVVQQLAQPEDFILEKFAIDVVDIGRMFNERDEHWHNTTLADGSAAQYPIWFNPIKRENGKHEVEQNGRIIAQMPANGTFFDQTYFPYIDGYPSDYKNLPTAMNTVLWAAMPPSPWDHAAEDNFWQQLRERTIQLRQTSDRAIIIGVGCNLFEWGTFLRRMDNFLMDIMMDQVNVEAMLDALMEIHLNTLDKACKAVGDVADILRFGDDLGMISGPFMSPDIYRQLFKPRHTKLNEFVHKNSSLKTYLHSCGSVYALMPDLIEAGYDVINPVQTNCYGMDPVTLKKEFGKDITFWGGGCDTATVLNNASPADVKKHVIERLKILSPGGGYVFNTVHNILPEVPPENVIAMFEAIRAFNG